MSCKHFVNNCLQSGLQNVYTLMCNVAFFTQRVVNNIIHNLILRTQPVYELGTNCLQNVYRMFTNCCLPLRMCFGGQKTTLFTRVHINTQKIHYMTPKTRLESGKHFVNNRCESGKHFVNNFWPAAP